MPTHTFATRILPEAPAMGLANERYRCQQFQLLERNLLVATIAGGKRRVATSDLVDDVDIIIIIKRLMVYAGRPRQNIDFYRCYTLIQSRTVYSAID